MSQHAPLAPSSAKQWKHCAGSPVMQSQFSPPPNLRTVGGTASHWVGEQCLNVIKHGGQAKPEQWIGQVDPDGTVIDAEMAEGAAVWVEHCLALCKRYDVPLCDMQVEQKVHARAIHDHCYGTPDFWAYSHAYRCVLLSDYKYGHREVVTIDNEQLVCYLQGIIEALGFNGHDAQAVSFECNVVQPFCYQRDSAVDTWRGMLTDIRGHVNQLAYAAQKVFKNPLLTSGEHCRDCDARGRCPAARKANYALIDYVDHVLQIDDMSLQELEAERDVLQRGLAVLKTRAETIDDEIKHRLTSGGTCGLILETGQGRLNFNVPVEQAVAFCAQFGIDAAKPGVKTPTQVLDSASREIRPHLEQALKTITARKTTGLKLTKRENSKTARAFRKE